MLQAGTLEWVAISFLATPWTATYQAPPSVDFPGKSTGVGCHCLLPTFLLLLPYLQEKPFLRSDTTWDLLRREFYNQSSSPNQMSWLERNVCRGIWRVTLPEHKCYPAILRLKLNQKLSALREQSMQGTHRFLWSLLQLAPAGSLHLTNSPRSGHSRPSCFLRQYTLPSFHVFSHFLDYLYTSKPTPVYVRKSCLKNKQTTTNQYTHTQREHLLSQSKYTNCICLPSFFRLPSWLCR